MGNIVIFGGTFDPIHIGHLKIYLSIKKQLSFDKFLVIPTKIPPLKDHKAYADTKDRLAMIKLMFDKYRDIEIDQYELNKTNNHISYTYNTIKYLKSKYPNDNLYLAVGLDRYDDFKKWKNWKLILENVRLIIIPRHRHNINIANQIVIKMPLINISSSQLRKNPSIKYLTKPIANYISANGLYIDEQIKPLLSPSRYQHTLRVMKLAMELTMKINKLLLKKVYIASMYHDVCKEFDDKNILTYSNNSHKHIHTLHGIAGANYVKKHFNINDKEILDAISNHVIPQTNCSLLSKILYCADKLEPARTKHDINNRLGMLKLIKKDINKYFPKLVSEIQQKYHD